MSLPDRANELIQRHLEALSSPAELAELESMLAADPAVTNAFAEAARLHAGLQDYFQKQYKMGQVAALLSAPASPDSTFVPGYARPIRTRRSRFAGRFKVVARRWKWLAAAALLVTIGVALWSSTSTDKGRLRVISGRVAVAGRDMTEIPENVLFEVAGHDPAAIELPGGVRIELVPSSRAAIRRGLNRTDVHLESGGGQFSAPSGGSALRIETVLGVVVAKDARLSLTLMTALPPGLVPTEPVRLPRLIVAVAQGSVVFERAGTSTILSTGEEYEFLNET